MQQSRMNESEVIIFEEGIPGFEHLKMFLITEQGDDMFYYLQSVEDENISFPIVNPYHIKPDYAPNIHESYFEKLGGGDTRDFTLFVIMTVRNSIEESTVNLQAPLLIQVEKRIGIQAIVEDNNYQSRHKIIELIEGRSAQYVSTY